MKKPSRKLVTGEDQEKEKNLFWTNAAWITAVATLLAALLTGTAAIIGALPKPLPVTPTSFPTALVVHPLSTNINQCPMYYIGPPVYKIPVGIMQTLPQQRPLTQPFALEFIESGQDIGGMKLQWNGNGNFTVFNVADENCFDITPTDQSIDIPVNQPNELQYSSGIYVLIIQVESNLLKVDFKHK